MNALKETPADLKILDSKAEALGFVSGEYSEAINGILPRLVARFICDADKIPFHLADVELELRILDSKWKIKANVDDIKFEVNSITIFFTLAPKEFYYVSTSNKFDSISNVVESLYFGSDIVGQDLLDTRPTEFNQMGVTDYTFLTTLLKSVGSPTVFSYGFNKLIINHLKDSPVKDIKEEEKPYDIDNKQKSFIRHDLVESSPNYNVVYFREGDEEVELLEWGGIKVQYNKDLSDCIYNLVENTIEQKKLKISTRIRSQRDLSISAGEIVNINLPDMDGTKYLVMDKLIILGSKLTFSYGLKSLDSN